MKVCVVGNSHASGLLSAWKSSPGKWPFDVCEFVVSPGLLSPDLRLVNRIFWPRSNSSVRSTLGDLITGGLDLAGFDAVVVSALGAVAGRNEHFASGRHMLGTVRRWDWPLRPERSYKTPVSTQMFDDLVKNNLLLMGTYKFARDLETMFDGPIFIQPSPRGTEDVIGQSDWMPYLDYGPEAARIYAEFADTIDSAISSIVGGMGKKTTLLPHPSVLTEAGYMKAQYGRNGDAWHGNGRHGKLILDQVAARL
jgi:hypothetical protein